MAQQPDLSVETMEQAVNAHIRRANRRHEAVLAIALAIEDAIVHHVALDEDAEKVLDILESQGWKLVRG